MTTVIDNAAIYTPTDAGETRWIPSGHVVIDGDRLTAVGPGRWTGTRAVERIDAGGRVAVPGFINTHTHTNLGLYPGLWDQRRFMRPEASGVVVQKAPPYTSFMTPDDHRYANYLTMIAAVRSGTTTLCNCDRYQPALTVEVAEKVGIRTHSGAMANDATLRPVGRPNWPAVRDEMVSLIRAHRGNPLRRFFIGAHSPYSCPPEQIQEAHAAATANDVDFNIHLAESQHELSFVRQRYATTPVRWLHQLGVLDQRVIANHVIFVDAEEIELLAATGVRIASCPFGAAKEGKVAPILDYLAHGIPVGLATDSLLSNNSVSMLREPALLIQLQHVRAGEEGLLFAEDALRIATLGGARVLGWQDQIGSLEVGKAADVVLFDVRHPWGLTAERVATDLVFAADRTSVSLVMVAGRKLFADRRVQTVDEPALWQELSDVYQRGGVREWETDYAGPAAAQ